MMVRFQIRCWMAWLVLCGQGLGCQDAAYRRCTTPSDCPDGGDCQNGKCVYPSQEDREGGLEDGGIGWEIGEPGVLEIEKLKACDSQGKCPDNLTCHNGWCVRVQAQADCASGDSDPCQNDTYCVKSLGGCVPWAAANGDDPGCEYIPPIETFTPVEEWSWTDPEEAPEWNEVIMTPVVIDLTGDVGDLENFVVPSVVFNSFNRALEYSQDGILRAVRGDDGSPIFSITNPEHYTHPVSGIAVGDIDGDGKPEIITGKNGGRDLICFESDGSFKWATQSDELVVYWGGPAIANVDGVGNPEIVIGAAVVDSEGNILWNKTGSRGENRRYGSASAPFSVPLDIIDDPNDPMDDGQLEIVTGDVLYAYDGEVIWDNGLGDGFVGVAEFTDDEIPDIVVVSRGSVRLQRGDDGRVIWLRTAESLNELEECSPDCGLLGPPTIANFDDDPEPEIGVAGADVYIVLDTWGQVLWHRSTQDSSSNITGSAVFDFEGDRKAEVVYADEVALRVYRGSDGTILYEQEHSSITACEYPVIADVDGDRNAEIIVAQNSLIEGIPEDKRFHGIRVFGDAQDNWVSTRRVWNQHAYNVTNVEEDGRIPVRANKNWQEPWKTKGYNNFRQNVQGDGLFYAPDLTIAGLGVDGISCHINGVWLLARVFNRGWQEVPPKVPVSFYKGDPRTGAERLGTVETQRFLLPGQSEQVALLWKTPPRDQAVTIYVVVDDQGWDLINGRPTGKHNECREHNNLGTIPNVICKPET